MPIVCGPSEPPLGCFNIARLWLSAVAPESSHLPSPFADEHRAGVGSASGSAIESPLALRNSKQAVKSIPKNWRPRIVAIVLCLLAGSLLIWWLPRLKVGRDRNRTLEALCVAAYSGDANAVERLVGTGTNSIPDLVALLQTRDSFFRIKLWSLWPRFSPQTRRYFAKKYPPPAAEYTRESAAHALGLLGPQARNAIPALIRALRDKEGRVHVEASWALSRIGPEAVPALVVALQDKDARARQAAIGSLSQIGLASRLALPELVQRLEDTDEPVRNSAAYALSTLGLPGVFALIAVTEQGSTNARHAASNILAAPYLSLRNAESELYLMAQEPSPTRRRQAIRALAYIHVAGDLAVHTAIFALQDPALEVRLAAIETLGNLGSRSQGSIPSLTNLMSDPEISIRVAARKALDRIEPKH